MAVLARDTLSTSEGAKTGIHPSSISLVPHRAEQPSSKRQVVGGVPINGVRPSAPNSGTAGRIYNAASSTLSPQPKPASKSCHDDAVWEGGQIHCRQSLFIASRLEHPNSHSEQSPPPLVGGHTLYFAATTPYLDLPRYIFTANLPLCPVFHEL
ncbi:hypothetical protein BP6252_11246 [Coleophoma cylindrospora]|uniref:Uncharacterized protein n=1 Tax=Coleophoma cylindrospora TaxID=1849047 RepID=A0A3D8QPQ4_9HELO|nr:hypothetical protein BP6252_11246 [Coleophoma cylindrospora]